MTRRRNFKFDEHAFQACENLNLNVVKLQEKETGTRTLGSFAQVVVANIWQWWLR